MRRFDSFTFRVNSEERQMLSALAYYLRRSKSDTVRELIRAATHELQSDEPNKSLGNIHDTNVLKLSRDA